ncbi:helix-turn-helix domain-containing protein [Verrucomicrobiaceae bacterium R5-34]|nr:helix-turn-helix domain-containing protein [Verrucomicrobiaceae bacterium R5-34]
MKGRPEIMTLPEVADYLKASVKTVRRRIEDGLIKSFKDGGRRLVIANDLEEYIQTQIKREERK